MSTQSYSAREQLLSPLLVNDLCLLPQSVDEPLQKSISELFDRDRAEQQQEVLERHLLVGVYVAFEAPDREAGLEIYHAQMLVKR